MTYSSARTLQSATYPGVEFTIRCMSFGRRMELLRAVREVSRQLEFHSAGTTVADRADAALTSAVVDRLYFEWGFIGVTGLAVDDVAPDGATLLDRGPELLIREIICEIRKECGLTEEDRKN